MLKLDQVINTIAGVLSGLSQCVTQNTGDFLRVRGDVQGGAAILEEGSGTFLV